METVFLLWHVNGTGEDEDEKLIGVYKTEELARAAMQRSKDKPGFSETPEGFICDKYELNRDYWETGFRNVSSKRGKRIAFKER